MSVKYKIYDFNKLIIFIPEMQKYEGLLLIVFKP